MRMPRARCLTVDLRAHGSLNCLWFIPVSSIIHSPWKLQDKPYKTRCSENRLWNLWLLAGALCLFLLAEGTWHVVSYPTDRPSWLWTKKWRPLATVSKKKKKKPQAPVQSARAWILLIALKVSWEMDPFPANTLHDSGPHQHWLQPVAKPWATWTCGPQKL